MGEVEFARGGWKDVVSGDLGDILSKGLLRDSGSISQHANDYEDEQKSSDDGHTALLLGLGCVGSHHRLICSVVKKGRHVLGVLRLQKLPGAASSGIHLGESRLACDGDGRILNYD